MSAPLEDVLKKFKNNPKKYKRLLAHFFFSPRNCIVSFSPGIFKNVWMALLRQHGFYESVQEIQISICNYAESFENQRNNSTNNQIVVARESLLKMVAPILVSFELDFGNTPQLLSRSKKLLIDWKLDESYCAGMLTHFEGQQKKGGENKFLSQLLSMFKTTESKVDYKYEAISVLEQAVGKTLYEVSIGLIQFQDIYKDFIMSNKKKLQSLLEKLKNRPVAFSSVLSELTLPETNTNKECKIKNILLLFLLFEYWHKIRKDQGKLKQHAVIQIWAEAFHRIMFLCYCSGTELRRIFLMMLGWSLVDKYPIILEKISYHLVALHKLCTNNDDMEAASLMEELWKDKFGEVKINQAYLFDCPKFIFQSQKIQKSLQEEQLFAQLPSKMVSQIMSQAKSNKKSQSRAGAVRKWICSIQLQLKQFNLERVFLLLKGLKLFYLKESVRLEPILKQRIFKLVITIIKKIEANISYRYKCQLLVAIIHWELSDLHTLALIKQFNYDEQVMGIGSFNLCSFVQGSLNIEELIGFHKKFNYQQTLQTVMCLYLLEDAVDDEFKKDELMNKVGFSEDSFQFELFQLFKYQLLKDQKQQKRLITIMYLLRLKSQNVTNNLLVNYVNFYFSQKCQEEIMLERYDRLSNVMNRYIQKQQNQERVRLFLKMSNVFQELQKRSKDPLFYKTNKPVSEKYFHFMLRPEHKNHYLLYSKLYQQFHYFKEAICFLELHCQEQPYLTQKKELKIRAVNLYQKMNSSFSNSLSHIAKYQELEINEMNEEANNEKIRLSLYLQCAVVRVDFYDELNECGNILEDTKLSFECWNGIIERNIYFFYKRISQCAESESIKEQMLKLQIFFSILQLKLKERVNKVEPSTILPNIIEKIEGLQKQQTQLVFSRDLLKYFQNSNNFQNIQEYYLEKLVKNKQSKELMNYLSFKKDQTDFAKKYLRYIIRDNYQNKKFIEALAFIKEYQKIKDLTNQSQIYQLQLQCKYNVLLNFTISEYLSFINRNAIIPLETKDNQVKYFQFYFKIFRMLFQRYNFTRMPHNQAFWQAYFAFMNASKILTQNKQYLSEAIFYLLRFILQKLWLQGKPQLSQKYATEIIDYFKGHSKEFVPFCSYLLKKVSSHSQKNIFISLILNFVLSQNSKQCIWSIAFLKNFESFPSKQKFQSQEEENESKTIKMVYKKILEDLFKKNVVNKSHLQYLQMLTKFSAMETEQKKMFIEEFKKISIPAELPFVFAEEFNIQNIKQIKLLSNGKSAPLQIDLSINNNSQYKMLSVIIKCISPAQYRMESNTANFFSDIGLMDKETTYRIFNLSKNIIIIEHVQSCGTIGSIITDNFKAFRYEEMKEKQQFLKQMKEKNIFGQQALTLYDQINFQAKVKVKFCSIIRQKSKSFSDWWEKYMNFVRTNAHWSFVGYVIGLGDRHLDNILMTQNCKLVHIDFEYALDIGYKLPYPEWVPFRHTHCLLQPLGILGSYGVFYAEMINIAKKFNENEGNIWKALSNFAGPAQNNFTSQIINRSKFDKYQVNYIEQGIARIIESAKNGDLLRLMFRNWAPYI